jgi:hypothetical protein
MWQHFGKSGCQLDLRMQMQAAFISLLEDLAPVVWQTETAIQCGSSNNGGIPKLDQIGNFEICLKGF